MSTARRPYRSVVREQRAAETREEVVDAAGRCFEEVGWSGTTMSGIARTAGVSVKTVHAVGSKADLLVEAFRVRYVGGGGWVSITEESEGAALLAVTDPVEAVATMTAWIGNAHRASGRLWYVLRTTALVEPTVRRQQDDLMRYKQESYGLLARKLLDLGVVPAEEVPEHLMDRFVALLNLVMSAETYVQLVWDSGFTHEQYLAWVRAAIPTIRPC
ncbi:TetR/AcrR family transcriptional regulator [Nocardioides sp. CFH 31398]|uniref:TetR/AcrR family transcriptional regulator n=1 Tax=Nocardioides sp. CFH 31398 TaxID=2919579 RepID=UPI001F069CDD|nr:TetR/AcrR family transcriptional regulator [Nocardioides sp. CFH 31398]MCH1867931.1 TetR/AcrR family transcriptional regulator [Nocardioides sp. CFH 31398]